MKLDKEWQEWALKHEISPEVISYVAAFNPDVIADSMQAAADVIPTLPDFKRFEEVYKQLPSTEEIIAGKRTGNPAIDFAIEATAEYRRRNSERQSSNQDPEK